MSNANKKGHAKTSPNIGKGRCNKRMMILWQNNATTADVNKPNLKSLSNKNKYDRRYLRIRKKQLRKGRATERKQFLNSIMKKLGSR